MPASKAATTGCAEKSPSPWFRQRVHRLRIRIPLLWVNPHHKSLDDTSRPIGHFVFYSILFLFYSSHSTSHAYLQYPTPRTTLRSKIRRGGPCVSVAPRT